MLWSTKEIYFIRHGESAQNAEHLRQGPIGKLSELGRKQVDFVGRRFERIPLQIILVSPYERTRETAAIINEHLHLPMEENDLLIERKNPSEIVGKDADSIEVKKIIDAIDRSYHQNNFRYSDEENFEDLKNRAKKLLAYLAHRSERKIMCVSHRIFLKMVAAYIENGDALSSKDFVKLDFLNKTDNASVTFAKYSPWKTWGNKDQKEKAGWELLAWNDAGHIV